MSPLSATLADAPRPVKARARQAPAVTLAPRQVLWLAALIVAAQLPHVLAVPAWISATSAALVGLRLFLLRRDLRNPAAPPTRIPPLLLVVCAAAMAGAIRLSYGYFLGREPCVAFLGVLVATKFVEARNTRDGALLACLASFLLVTPFFYSQSLLAAIAAAPALLLIGAVLDVLARRPGPGAAETSWTAPLLRTSRLLLHGVPLAAVLFLLFPRLAAPLWGLPQDHAGMTGLSDRMAPGSISELSLSDAIAFRVDFDGPAPPAPQRYWRGPVLSRFDGREWTQQVQRLESPLAATDAPSVAYAVTLEPHFKPWLFALDLPSSLPRAETDADAGGEARTAPFARLTRTQQLIARSLVTQPVRYHQRSVLRDRYAADAALDGTDNLRLPRNPNYGNPKTLEFAQALRAEHRDDADYIRAVLAWFTRESFVYTLAPPLLDRDPVDEFLFETRRGFCEHYASAFVLLLRAAGIPARVVTGYQGGEMNPRGGYMIVRQSDAHAWAEAIVDGEWRRYDPTAAVAPSRIEMGLGGALPESADVPILARLDIGWFKTFQLSWDAVNHGWRRQIIGFNHDRQRSLWRDWKVDRLAPWQYVAMVAAFALAWVGLVLGWLLWQRHRRDRARAHWQALCARLARAGLPRLPHEGPLDYAGRAAARWPALAAEFRAIGEAYAALRYGVESARADSDRGRAAALARLGRAIRALPASSALRAHARLTPDSA